MSHVLYNMSLVRRKNASPKTSFSKERILENFRISRGKDYTKAILKNSQANIFLKIPDSEDVEAELHWFEIPSGAFDSDGKCALYALLLELVRKKNIEVNRTVRASGTLMKGKMSQLGFVLGDPKPGLPTPMSATVENILRFLGDQCTMVSYERDTNNQISELQKDLSQFIASNRENERYLYNETARLRQLTEMNQQRSEQNEKKLEKKAKRFFSFGRKNKLHEDMRF